MAPWSLREMRGPARSSLENARAGDKRSKGLQPAEVTCAVPLLQSVAGEEIEEASSLQQGECALSHGGSQTLSCCPALLWWDGDSWGLDI